MKILANLFAVFVLGVFLLSHAIAGQEATGEWSAERQNLKARFVARYQATSLDGKADGPYSEFLVYLELQNTCPAQGTILLRLDMDPATNITYRVTDEKGHLVEPEPGFRSTIRISGYNLVLPQDSHLRFPISANGGGVSPDKTKLDVSPLRGTWYFDRGAAQEFRLSGTLRVPRTPERHGWWQGELEIPPVRLAIPGPSAQGGAAAGSQPSRSETNRASGAAGSRR